MKQLALDIIAPAAPSFDNFVAGPNSWLVARLRALALPHSLDLIYLWGGQGSGRTHLLHATAQAARSANRPVVWAAAESGRVDLSASPGALVLADDIERLDETGQIALFRAFNTASMVGLAMLLAGCEPPLRQNVREDLRTRLGAMLVFELKPLSDEEKAQTLLRHAHGRGLRVGRDVIDYLLRHGRRDLPALLGVLDALDRACLERKRPVTVPLLREILRPSE